jgi:hypothetical protein
MNRPQSIFTCTIGLVLFLAGPAALLCTAADTGFDKTLTREGVSFKVTCANNGSINTLHLNVSGLKKGDAAISREIDGSVAGAEVGDLDGNGLPEVYVFISSAGSGSYGDVVAYSVNSDDELQAIALAPLEDDPQNLEGYMGHDNFTLTSKTLIRSFPIYRKNDPNSSPSGGKRQIRYGLVHTDKGFLLRPVCMSKQ